MVCGDVCGVVVVGLLGKGADGSARKCAGWKGQLWACENGLAGVAVALLEKGADEKAKEGGG